MARMTRVSRSCAPLLVAVLAAGCDEPPSRATPTATQATSTAPASTSATAGGPSDDTQAIEVEFEQAPDTEIPGGKEAGCVARVVRKFVRVICSARDGHAAPDTIVKTQSNKNLQYRDIGGPIAHVSTIFEPGLDMKATFVWGDKARELTMRWPDGAPRPSSYGSFGPETAFANPCKPHGLPGFGSKGVPCRFKEPTMLTLAWTTEFGPDDASPETKKPMFEVENKSTVTIQSFTVTLSFFDGAGKPVEHDTLGDAFVPTAAYSHDRRIAPKSKKKIPLGPERPLIPSTVKRIDVTLRQFSSPDPESYFAREESDKKDEGKKEKK
jgi:hypothetical protein